MYFLGSLTLLIFALICIIVLRDRRDLKIKQIAIDLSRLEEMAKEMGKIKDEMMPTLSALKKHTDTSLSQIESQIKQINSSIANMEQRLQITRVAGEKQEDGRDRDRDRGRSQKQSGKGKEWVNNRPDNKHKDYSGAPQGKDEMVAINDGEKYARISELAAHGLTAQEIAKKLHLGQDEVTLVLELKGKKPV